MFTRIIRNHAWRSEHKLTSQNVSNYCRYCYAFRETVWVFFLNGLRKYQREKRFDKIFEAKCGMENAITSTLPCLKTVESRYKKPVSHLKSFQREGCRMLSIKTYPRLTSSSFYYLSLVSFFPKNFLECSPSPSFFVRSSGSSAYRYGQPSWFHMYRGGGCQGL